MIIKFNNGRSIDFVDSHSTVRGRRARIIPLCSEGNTPNLDKILNDVLAPFISSPDTCDICKSLDQEEDYEMWQPSSEVQIADWLRTVLELIDDSDRPDARGLVITWEKIAEKLGYNPSTLRMI